MSNPGYGRGVRENRQPTSEQWPPSSNGGRSGSQMGQIPPGTAPPSVVAPDPGQVGESNAGPVAGESNSKRDPTPDAATTDSSGPLGGIRERITSLELTQRDILERIEPSSTSDRVGVEAGKGVVSTLGSMLGSEGAGAAGAALGSIVPGIGTAAGMAAGGLTGKLLGGALGGAMGGAYERGWDEGTDLLDTLAGKVLDRIRGELDGEGMESDLREQRNLDNYF